MKAPIILGRWLVVLSAVMFGSLLCSPASAQTQTNKLRVGVYDSRAVAVAYANSTEFQDTMKSIVADHKKAKETKDEKRVREIESQMKSQQRRAHEQGFSTGSIASIMAKVNDSLPNIASKAGVQIIVSKWELNHQSSEIETVDVTDQVVALFHVSERGLKWCKEIQQKPPLPIEKLTDHMD
jgi:Skp family chaperone for outer membrane proteins